jgi:hypothetical protein
MSENSRSLSLPGMRTIPAVVRLWTAWNPSPELIFADCRERGPEPRTLVPQKATEVPVGGRGLGAADLGLTGFEGRVRGWLTR